MCWAMWNGHIVVAKKNNSIHGQNESNIYGMPSKLFPFSINPLPNFSVLQPIQNTMSTFIIPMSHHQFIKAKLPPKKRKRKRRDFFFAISCTKYKNEYEIHIHKLKII